MKRDLLTIRDLTADEIRRLIARAQVMKREWAEGSLQPILSRRVLGLIFSKPSTRTRVSFEAAMYRLGGDCVFLTEKDSQISRSEPLADTARVLSRYTDAIAVRTFAQSDVEELARFSSIPVINALTDQFHPCQVLSDLLTIQEKRGSLDGLHVAWVGDGNNVAHSWINAAARLGFTLSLACPPGYEPSSEVLEWAKEHGTGTIQLTRDPHKAVLEADVLYTDVWASMGQEDEAENRRKVFREYQINASLMNAAPASAMVLHCLPAHRGEEITADVLEGPRSAVFDQAENRLHFQMALLEWVITQKG
ncbi:MAG: ornithine carbamoyltransferase [Deltaproteobacteria bacterium]|nr:ornithine carbamoyltransferase [Deltaproteobacteria bacterium]